MNSNPNIAGIEKALRLLKRELRDKDRRIRELNSAGVVVVDYLLLLGEGKTATGEKMRMVQRALRAFDLGAVARAARERESGS